MGGRKNKNTEKSRPIVLQVEALLQNQTQDVNPANGPFTLGTRVNLTSFDDDLLEFMAKKFQKFITRLTARN